MSSVYTLDAISCGVAYSLYNLISDEPISTCKLEISSVLVCLHLLVRGEMFPEPLKLVICGIKGNIALYYNHFCSIK